MVSLNLNSPEGFYLDSFLPAPEDFPLNEMVEIAASANDDSNSKVRKPYTISKSRESWSEPEHDKFVEALQLFDRDWKKIEAFIGSKTVIQIRSHAQKYFLKVQKSGTNEHLPPPRPKRKASHPYPQKAPKSASQANGSLHRSSRLLEPGIQRQDPTLMPLYPNSTATLSSWATNSLTGGVLNGPKDEAKSSGPIIANNCSSSSESTAMVYAPGHFKESMMRGPPLKVLPDFAQVYSFIGSVFDPEASDHLLRLRNMDPIDVETVLLLMRNLSINLMSPDFEDHRNLLSSYDIESNKAISGGMNNIACGD